MRRPWNIIDSPVYSLSTCLDGVTNMNICTYVTAISMKPKQYMIAVYYGTRTHDILTKNANCALQLLSNENASLVRKLGKQSGRNVDKHSWLKKKDLLITWKEHQVLNNACAYLELELIDRFETGGDHEIFCFQVNASKTLHESNILMFQNLVDAKIIL